MLNKMNLILFGISHKTAPVEIREKYSITKKNNFDNKQYIILSTCNRTEVYTTTCSPQETKNEIIRLLEVEYEDLDYFYFLKDKDVVVHIFRVASGLDSQIIGETQILGQVKHAYNKAKEFGMNNKYLDDLFKQAIEVGKLVREKTDISKGNISICSVAIKMIKTFFNEMENKKVLIIGTGKIGELVAQYLLKEKMSYIFVANRTYEKAKELAEKINAKAIKFDQLNKELIDADIVVSATASPHLILKKNVVEEIMKFREKKLFIFDLALPRDVDPEIRNLKNVILYDLDDINLVVEENYKRRLKEAEKAEKIVKEEAEKIWQQLEKKLLSVVEQAA